jgi:hypothetical protein
VCQVCQVVDYLFQVYQDEGYLGQGCKAVDYRSQQNDAAQLLEHSYLKKIQMA